MLDTDGDGLNDSDEITTYFTDPLNPDSDDDGYTDGEEVVNFTDPNDADDPAPEIDDGGIIPDDNMKQSVISFFKSEGLEGVGQLYFCGLKRFTQFKYLRFVTIIEIIGSIVTICHAMVFYYAENELISKETFMIEFEIGYFIFLNLLPMFIMIWQFSLSSSIKQFRLAQSEEMS